MVFDLFEVGAGGRLVAAEAGEPPGVRLERAHEGFDFADGAALGGLHDVEQAELALVFFERGAWEGVDEVEFPVAGEAVAVLEEGWEVVAGFEEDDGDLRGLLEEVVEDDHVFGLEGAGEAEVAGVRGAEDLGD